VAGFSMFAFILNKYSKLRSNFRMALHHTHTHTCVPLDASVPCVAAMWSQFLLSGCAS
jgi:hypothetical protein